MRTGGPYCPECMNNTEEAYSKVRDFIDRVPANNITMVSEATGVSAKRILNFVREGRLTLSHDFDFEGLLRCSICNKPISAGKMCHECQHKLGLDDIARIKHDKEEDGQEENTTGDHEGKHRAVIMYSRDKLEN
ncbi:MAG: hypothetical protein LBS19_09985 [Clostridiales bacterium]|nr:hypothetical protein [Clostridiales bacterium]